MWERFFHASENEACFEPPSKRFEIMNIKHFWFRNYSFLFYLHLFEPFWGFGLFKTWFSFIQRRNLSQAKCFILHSHLKSMTWGMRMWHTVCHIFIACRTLILCDTSWNHFESDLVVEDFFSKYFRTRIFDCRKSSLWYPMHYVSAAL